MKLLNVFTIILAITISSSVYGQKLKVVSGDLSKLKGVEKVSTHYDFSEFGVGKLDKEADYVNKKTADMNEDEAGHGDEWKAEWESDKLNKFKPKFEELFTDYAENISIADSSEVVMNIKTTFIEPGFNVGVMRKPSLIDLTVSFKKGDEELVTITVLQSPGNAASGFDYDDGLRISESYAKAGKELGKLLTKKVK